MAPPDHHMRLTRHAVHLDRGPKVKHTRPAADPLFQSAAESFGSRVVGVVLTGGDFDGIAGLVAIKAHGGIGIVQDPREAEMPSMPASALRDAAPDYCLLLTEIAPLLVELSQNPMENADSPMLTSGCCGRAAP